MLNYAANLIQEEASDHASMADTARKNRIITHTHSIEEFRRAIHGQTPCAVLPRPLGGQKQKAISESASRIEFVLGTEKRSRLQFPFKISSAGIVSLQDEKNILDPVVKQELETMGQLYYEKTAIPQITTAVYENFHKTPHEHAYPLINIVWDKIDNRNSEEIGTTFIDVKGREAAPLNAYFWLNAFGYHSAERKTNRAMTFIVRPTDEYEATHLALLPLENS